MVQKSRRSFVRKATATVVGISALGTAGTHSLAAQTTDNEYESSVEQAIHEKVNRIRSDRGVESLTYSDDLAEVAAYHSQDMAENDYLSHTSPSGETMSDRYERFDLNCRRWGENILYNYAGDMSPTAAAQQSVDQWMGSDGHRQNILSDSWTAQGVGAKIRSDERLYVTQNFGTGCD
jgi:uncharacterized protein YkwD